MGLAYMTRLSVTVIGCCAMLTVTTLLMAQTKPAPPPKETFVILYEPGPKWIKGREIFDQDLQEHGQYMAKLLQQGHLELGGPFSDSSGGMGVIEVKDEDEAKAILKNDPGVNSGVFKATLHPWYVVFRKSAS
jgi:uncharacterized protein YciI